MARRAEESVRRTSARRVALRAFVAALVGGAAFGCAAGFAGGRTPDAEAWPVCSAAPLDTAPIRGRRASELVGRWAVTYVQVERDGAPNRAVTHAVLELWPTDSAHRAVRAAPLGGRYGPAAPDGVSALVERALDGVEVEAVAGAGGRPSGPDALPPALSARRRDQDPARPAAYVHAPTARGDTARPLVVRIGDAQPNDLGVQVLDGAHTTLVPTQATPVAVDGWWDWSALNQGGRGFFCARRVDVGRHTDSR